MKTTVTKENLDILLRKTMTKKAYKALCKQNRASVNWMNTGTRTHKSAKDYSRRYKIEEH